MITIVIIGTSWLTVNNKGLFTYDVSQNRGEVDFSLPSISKSQKPAHPPLFISKSQILPLALL